MSRLPVFDALNDCLTLQKSLMQAIYNFWKEQEFSGNLKKSEDGKSYILNEIGASAYSLTLTLPHAQDCA
jgi:hypothetical protein